MARLNINGTTRDIDVHPDTPLLWAIREQVGLTGTKYGCGIAQCGACTVHVDGAAVRACSMPVSAFTEDQKIVTIEDRKSTRLNSSHANISYAVFCLKKKKRRP